jgi:hypothetical protein
MNHPPGQRNPSPAGFAPLGEQSRVGVFYSKCPFNFSWETDMDTYEFPPLKLREKLYVYGTLVGVSMCWVVAGLWIWTQS